MGKKTRRVQTRSSKKKKDYSQHKLPKVNRRRQKDPNVEKNVKHTLKENKRKKSYRQHKERKKQRMETLWAILNHQDSLLCHACEYSKNCRNSSHSKLLQITDGDIKYEHYDYGFYCNKISKWMGNGVNECDYFKITSEHAVAVNKINNGRIAYFSDETAILKKEGELKTIRTFHGIIVDEII